MSTLAGFHRWAGADPTVGLARPKLSRRLPRPIAEEDLATALRTASQPVRVWLVLAAFAGLRCAEIAGLHVDDVQVDEAALHILGKGGHERVVPAHPKVMAELEPWLGGTGPVFRSRVGGGAYRPSTVSNMVNGHLHSVGVDATAHQLRHRFATRAYASAGDLRVVQELLGHRSVESTAGYAAFSRAKAVAAVGGI
jgi:integrase/recombinase XerC